MHFNTNDTPRNGLKHGIGRQKNALLAIHSRLLTAPAANKRPCGFARWELLLIFAGREPPAAPPYGRGSAPLPAGNAPSAAAAAGEAGQRQAGLRNATRGLTNTNTAMKKTKMKAAACLMAAAITLSSCIGSFGLFNKVLDWNKGLSNKFVNEIVFILISPAYAVCGVVDLLVLNTVEFWSGSNPIAKVGSVQNVWGQDGRLYAVKTLEDGYEVTKPTGEKVLFTYDERLKSWSMEADGQQRELFRFNDDGTIQAMLPNGERKDISLNEEGVYSLHMAMNDGLFFAAR